MQWCLSAEPLVGLDQIRAGMGKQLNTPGFKLTWEPTKAEFLGKGDIGIRRRPVGEAFQRR